MGNVRTPHLPTTSATLSLPFLTYPGKKRLCARLQDSMGEDSCVVLLAVHTNHRVTWNESVPRTT